MLRPRLGPAGRGTIVGPGTRAGAGAAPELGPVFGSGALLKNDDILKFLPTP